MPTYLVLVCRLACIFATSTVAVNAFSSDAGKDPGGWNSVKLGMSREQVIQSLNGNEVGPEAKPDEDTLFNLTGVLDVPALASACDEILVDAKANAEAYEEDLLGRCRELKRLLGQRQWNISERGARAGKRTLSAKLVSLVDSGDAGGGITVLLMSKKGHETFAQSDLDAGGRKSLATVHEIAELVSAYYTTTGRRPVNTPTRHAVVIAVPPRSIEIGGLKLIGTFAFTSNELTAITFRDSAGVREAGDYTNSYQTIKALLSDKYGPPDDVIDDSSRSKSIWRFPKTIITVKRAPGFFESGAMGEGLSVTYETPTAENAVSDKDKL